LSPDINNNSSLKILISEIINQDPKNLNELWLIVIVVEQLKVDEMPLKSISKQSHTEKENNKNIKYGFIFCLGVAGAALLPWLFPCGVYFLIGYKKDMFHWIRGIRLVLLGTSIIAPFFSYIKSFLINIGG